MCFQLIVICERCLGRGPQQGIVVWEGGEEHAKEEARGYEWSKSAEELVCGQENLRPMIMKVAKEPDPPWPFGLS